MKAINIDIGSRVRMVADVDHKGTVIGNKLPSGDEVLAIEWDNGELDRVNVHDVELYDAQIEKDFEQVQKEIELAAEALGRANALCSKHKTDLSSAIYNDDYHITIRSLFQELNGAGWSTSSMNC